jgi:hypothetical protein
MGKPEEMHAAQWFRPAARASRWFICGGKPRFGQSNCISRLGQACSFFPSSRLVAEYDVSQFSSVLLLVITLTLTVCFGVAAWRTSGDTSEVTGGILLPLNDPR